MSFWQISTVSEYMFSISALYAPAWPHVFFLCVAPGRAKVARVPSLGRLWVAAVASLSLFVEKHRPFKINSELSFWQGIYDIECVWMCIPACRWLIAMANLLGLSTPYRARVPGMNIHELMRVFLPSWGTDMLSPFFESHQKATFFSMVGDSPKRNICIYIYIHVDTVYTVHINVSHKGWEHSYFLSRGMNQCGGPDSLLTNY